MLTQQLKSVVYQQEAVRYEYTPDYIQEQWALAFGLDFIAIALLCYYDSTAILVNATFKILIAILPLERLVTHKARNLVIEQLTTEDATIQQRQHLLSRINRNPNDAFYTMDYRVNDNNVIMRLRAWCPNVEVIFPWNLRQRMKVDMEKTWKLYESDR